MFWIVFGYTIFFLFIINKYLLAFLFAKGFILKCSGRIKRGDIVKIEGVEGRVRKVGWLTTEIADFDGTTAIIPNSKVIKSTIVKQADPLIISEKEVEFKPAPALPSAPQAKLIEEKRTPELTALELNNAEEETEETEEEAEAEVPAKEVLPKKKLGWFAKKEKKVPEKEKPAKEETKTKKTVIKSRKVIKS